MKRFLFKTGLLIIIILSIIEAFSGCRTDKLENMKIVSEEDENTSEKEETIDQSTKDETEHLENISEDPNSSESSLEKEDTSDIEKLFVLGNCEYNGFSGTAQIINIDIINQEEIAIVFNFVLQNPEDESSYRFPNFPDNEYRKRIIVSPDNSNIIITETAVIQIGNIKLQSGDKLECIRLEITKGTCTPVIFLLPEIDAQSN